MRTLSPSAWLDVSDTAEAKLVEDPTRGVMMAWRGLLPVLAVGPVALLLLKWSAPSWLL